MKFWACTFLYPRFLLKCITAVAAIPTRALTQTPRMEEIPSAETEWMRSKGMPKYMLSLQAKTDRIFVPVNVPNFMGSSWKLLRQPTVTMATIRHRHRPPPSICQPSPEFLGAVVSALKTTFMTSFTGSEKIPVCQLSTNFTHTSWKALYELLEMLKA